MFLLVSSKTPLNQRIQIHEILVQSRFFADILQNRTHVCIGSAIDFQIGT